MKKAMMLVAVSAMVLGMVGCSSTPKAPVKEAALQCYFPDAPGAKAPGWVCDERVEGIEVSAIGIYEATGAGLQFQKDQATAYGRVALAQQMRVRVANMVKQYVETTGAASSETVDKVNTSVSKLITNESLEGSKAFMTAISQKGTLYALVGLDSNRAKAVAEGALKSSMKNEQALWQQFKAQKGQDELAADIAKLTAK